VGKQGEVMSDRREGTLEQRRIVRKRINVILREKFLDQFQRNAERVFC
jgi:hypothetical protein